MANKIAIICLLALIFSSLAASYDPTPLQDFCVAKKGDEVKVYGDVCQDPKKVELHKQGDANNTFGTKISTPVTVFEMPGLNTIGVTMAHIDIAPWGVNPVHLIHPRATEHITVLKGLVEVGFVTSNLDNRLITKQLQKGDVFVFPIGLVGLQSNNGNRNVVIISVLVAKILVSYLLAKLYLHPNLRLTRIFWLTHSKLMGVWWSRSSATSKTN